MGNFGDPSSRRFDDAHTPSLAQDAQTGFTVEQTLQAVGKRDAASLDVASEQLKLQAAQIADRLQAQLREIDCRESEFHARVARMENELRTARLVFREREHAIDQQRRDFQDRLQRLDSSEAGRGQRSPTFQTPAQPDFQPGFSVPSSPSMTGAATDAPIVVGEFQPGAIPTAVPLAIASGRDAGASDPPARQRYQQRLEELETQEQRLRVRLDQIAVQQQELDQQRDTLQQQHNQNEHQILESRKQARQAFDEERVKLRRRSDDLERRTHAVQKMQADTQSMYREAIELRICTEGMLGQLEDVKSPAEVARRLAELRRQLDDQYHLANQSLIAQQSELDGLVAKLAEHESRIGHQREELRGWIRRRQDEIEDQANKLLQRERDLSQQEASFQRLENQWQHQRDGYEQEIRRLKRMLVA